MEAELDMAKVELDFEVTSRFARAQAADERLIVFTYAATQFSNAVEKYGKRRAEGRCEIDDIVGQRCTVGEHHEGGIGPDGASLLP